MSELDNLLETLRNMKRTTPTFDMKTVWEGIAQRKDCHSLGMNYLWRTANEYGCIRYANNQA